MAAYVMSDPVLQFITQTVFVVAFVLSLVDCVRRPTVPRVELALLFGCLTPVIVQQVVSQTGGALPNWLSTLAVAAFLAHPYILLRLLSHFRAVPRYQHAIAVLALVGSWLVVLGGHPLPVSASFGLLLGFGYVEVYAAGGFIRTALATRGITRSRLVAVAVGSGCLGAVILVAGLAMAVPSAMYVTQPLSNVLALGSAVGYYIGFATPRWLRRTWQRGEVERFLIGLSGHSAEARVTTALDYLGPAAARATGGVWAAVAIREGDDRMLTLHVDSLSAGVMQTAGVGSVVVDGQAPALARAWREHQPIAASRPESWGAGLQTIAEAVGGVRGALIAPLIASSRIYGLFLVLTDRDSPFADDDLAVLAVLAEQAALSLERLRLLEDNARERTTLGAVMASMHDGLLVMDESGIVRYCNARTDELLGTRPGIFIGLSRESTTDTITSRLVESESSVAAELRQALQGPDVYPQVEVEVEVAGAPRRDVLLQSFCVADAAGVRRGTGIVLRDVTAERDLTRTKDELVSVVSHELRTPLASVVGFAELLRTRELAEPQRQQFLTVIAEEGRRLTALINDFLDLQRMGSGRNQINPRPARLEALVEQAVSSAGDDPLRPIQVTIDAGLPLVRADADSIQQVLSNLLNNARKYSPHGGTVRLTAREAEGQVTVSVQDQGLGIPPEAQSHLFQKFYRVDNSDRRQIKGTGLGLTISRRIIEAHGGRIWGESAGLGLGSRFSFTLPVVETPTTSGDVLIVEDDPGFARLMTAEMAERGLSAVSVSGVQEALEQVSTERPRAVVLDLLLPGADGEVFLRHLRKAGGDRVPVVVVTVKDLSADERTILDDLGVVEVLRKTAGAAAVTSDAIKRILSASHVRDAVGTRR